jgi:3-methyl-2-oxobutanoate hydroxymethyltransferase
MQEAGCDAIKPQGGRSQAAILRALVDAGIPTASHIGVAPHRVALYGGLRILGRTREAAVEILEDAFAIHDAGCFMLQFEAVPADIARLISAELEIPLSGLARARGPAGRSCSPASCWACSPISSRGSPSAMPM